MNTVEHKAKVGVIVPIWNAAPYIERCAESLMNQTLDDMQFVFVDDASPDDSIDILQEVLVRHPERANQVQIVHHDCNKGASTSRKTGLGFIHAKYVSPCDSDDWVEPTLYEKMYESACTNNADMVVCNEVSVPSMRIVERNHFPKDQENNYLLDVLHWHLLPNIWARLVRKEVYDKVTFPTENHLDDWVICVQLHAYSRGVNIIPGRLYHYTENPSSITNSNNETTCEETFRQCKANMQLVEDFVLSRNLAKEEDLVFLKYLVRKHLCPKLLRRQGRREYLDTYPEINWTMLKTPWVPRYYKVEHVAIWLNIYPEWCRLVIPAYQSLKRVIDKMTML